MTSISLDELMLLWQSVNDDAYTEPFLSAKAAGQVSNIEIFEQIAAQLARASEMVDRSTQAMYIMPWSGETNPPAGGSAYATAPVSIILPSPSLNTVTFSTNLIFQEVETDWGQNGGVPVVTGRQFQLESPITFSPGNVGPLTGTVVATVPGYSYNLCPIGSISQTVQPYTGDTPPYPTSSAIISNTDYPSGGSSPMLDMLGEERQVYRQSNETDDNYRFRVWRIADTVSPNAILRIINNILVQSGNSGVLRETGSANFPGFFFDVPAVNHKPSQTFAYDIDPTVYPNFRFNLIVDYLTMRAFFLIGVPTSISNSQATYGAIYAAVDAARAAGVGFDLYQITPIGSAPI
jgi:hypothetical protein